RGRVAGGCQQRGQSVGVARLPFTPQQSPGTTQPTQLFHASNQPSASIVPCNVFVQPGDIIGVLGACGTSTMFNSVGQQAAFSSAVLGQPVTLVALVTQTNLSTTAGAGPCS